MAVDAARKKREARRFTELDETPADAFDRMLHLGVPSMAHAPYQFGLAVTYVLRELQISDDETGGIQLHADVALNGGEFRQSCVWVASAERADKLENRTLALLSLRVLLRHIEGTKWKNIGGHLAADEKVRAYVCYPARAALFHEFLRLFWIAFVVQQLQEDGLRRRAVAAASADSAFEKMKRDAEKLRANGTHRAIAVKRIAELHKRTCRQASKACAAIKWHGRRIGIGS
jgi:hypothetical protein